MCDFPPLGGEPLWHVPGHPAIFASPPIRPNRVKTGGSRERPRAMHSLVAFDWFTLGPYELRRAG